jgi:hypothetical protein
LELVSELGPVTAVMLHPFVSMDITGMHRMPARPTVTMDPIGSMAACLSELDPGSTGSVEATGAVRASADGAVLADVDLQAGDLRDAGPDSLEEAGLPVARLDADRLVVDSAAVAAGPSTAVAASMVAAAVSTAVAEAMAAVGTGNSIRIFD